MINREKDKQNIYIGLISLGMILFYVLSLCTIDMSHVAPAYKSVVFLPIIYIVSVCVFVLKPLLTYGGPFTLIFILTGAVRYVYMPYQILYAGDYRGLAYVVPQDHTMFMAILLMAYEILMCCIVIRVMSNLTMSKNRGSMFKKAKLSTVAQDNRAYILFFLGMLGLVVVVPSASRGINFLFTSERSANGEIGNIFVLTIRQLFLVSKYFMFFYVIDKVLKEKVKHKGHYYLLLLLSVVVLGIRIGTNRKRFLSDGFACVMLLVMLFPKKKKQILLSIGGVGAILFIFMSTARGLVSSSDSAVSELMALDTIQQYFGGPYNVAIGIEATQMFKGEITLFNAFYDVLRPFFGIGELMKAVPLELTSTYFDLRMSLARSWRGDQILPMIGQGYMLFGFVFAPLLSCLNCVMGVFCDKLIRESEKVEVLFFASYFSSILAQGMMLNMTFIMNGMSFILVIALLAILGNKLLENSLKKEKIIE